MPSVLRQSHAVPCSICSFVKSTTTTFSIPEIGLDAARAGSVERTTVYDLLQFTCADLAKSPAFQDVGDAEGTLQMANFLQELREVCMLIGVKPDLVHRPSSLCLVYNPWCPRACIIRLWTTAWTQP